jgi:hypothetical protein
MKYPNNVTRTAACLSMVLAIAACAKKQEATSVDMEKMASSAAEAAAPAPAAPAAPQGMAADAADARLKPQEPPLTSATPAQQMGSSAATYTDSERKFIRKASARFHVKDVYAAALGIEDTVAAHGGFVVINNISTERLHGESHPVGDGKLLDLAEYRVQGELTVRVPSAKTQEFLRAIVGHIVFLDQRHFSAHDAQFDLLRRQLDAIRNQQTQGELGEAIEQGGKLGQRTDSIIARGDIKAARDAALLEKKEFEDQVAFSTITLSLYQPTRVVQTERVDIDAAFKKARPGFFPRLGEKLSGGWNGLLDFVLALAGIWPVLLVLALAVPVISRVRRLARRDKSSQS